MRYYALFAAAATMAVTAFGVAVDAKIVIHRNPDARVREGIQVFNPVKDHGADPSGILDATAALQASMADCTAAGGGQVAIAGYRLLFNTADVTVPAGCALVGSHAPHFKGQTAWAQWVTAKSAIIHNSTYTLKLESGAALKGVLVMASNLPAVEPATPQDGATLVANMANAGTGISLPGTTGGGGGVVMEDVQVIGFNFGVVSDGQNKLALRNLHVDSINGLSVTDSHDSSSLDFGHFWPTLTASKTWTTATANISGVANNGSGKIRLTVDSTASFATGNTLFVKSVGGFGGANTRCDSAVVVDATTIDCPILEYQPVVTAAVVSGEPVVTLNAENLAVTEQQTVVDLTTGGNIPGGTTVVAVSGNKVILSAPATGTGATDLLQFTNPAYTSGGVVTLSNNHRSGTAIALISNDNFRCNDCFSFDYQIGLDMEDEAADQIRFSSDGVTNPTQIGARIRGLTYASMLDSGWMVAGRPLVAESTKIHSPNTIRIARVYGTAVATSAVMSFHSGNYIVHDSAIQQDAGDAVYIDGAVNKVWFVGTNLQFATPYFQNAAARLATHASGSAFAGAIRSMGVLLTANTATQLTAGLTRFFYGSHMDAAEVNARFPMNRPGSLADLVVNLAVEPGGTETITVTVRVNGVDTPVACTITGAGRACSNTANIGVVAALDDKVSFKAVSSAAAAATHIQASVTFRSP